MTTTIDRAALLRPFAEAPCPGVPQGYMGDDDPGYSHSDWVWIRKEPCPTCKSEETIGLDPRFDALRGEHIWTGDGTCYLGNHAVWDTLPREHAYCLRTDLGALVQVAGACDEIVLDAVLRAIGDAFDLLHGWSEAPEDAGWRAFVAAWPLP